MGKFTLGILVFLSMHGANADVEINIIQTSDLHSHFTNTDSEFRLGGFARVKSKINQLRESLPNTLLLDAGDYSEGTMFFALDTGETSHRVMEAMGYDAIVLGNHDWLVGPKLMYEAYKNSDFKIPILSANLDTSRVPDSIDLQSYITPFLIKELGGVRIGIVGLSTYQFVFQRYASPAKIDDSIRVTKGAIKYLRGTRKCDLIFVLSHMGLDGDMRLAKKVPGIDAIFGGHNHKLFLEPVYQNNTPIFHVGKWGEYLGEIGITYSQGKSRVSKFNVHRIDFHIKEDPMLSELVNGALVRLEKKFGDITSVPVLRSEVDLPIHDFKNETVLGNWITDAVYNRLIDYDPVDVVVDSPTYAARDLYRGETNILDIFNMFPHIFNPTTQKTWTVKTFKMSGWALRYLLAAFYRVGLAIKLSHASLVLDYDNYLNPIDSFNINGKDVSTFSSVRVGATEGVYAALEYIRSWGVGLGIGEIRDTGLEPWQIAVEMLSNHAVLRRSDVVWDPRVRSVQPDLVIRPEEFIVQLNSRGQLALEFYVRNTGMASSNPTALTAEYEVPGSSILPPKRNIIELGKLSIPAIEGGGSVLFGIDWETAGLPSGRYPVYLTIQGAEHPKTTHNNTLKTYVDIP